MKDGIQQVLDYAHSLGTITEYPPLLTRERINRACLEYGLDGILPEYRDEWTPEVPTTNYCWLVSEVAYHLVMPEGTTAWKIDYGDRIYHWFLKDPDGNILDLTLDQIQDFNDFPEYEQAKRYWFRKKMSKRGKILAELLGMSFIE